MIMIIEVCFSSYLHVSNLSYHILIMLRILILSYSYNNFIYSFILGINRERVTYFICMIYNISWVIYSFKQKWPCIIFSALTGAIILGSDWQILCQCRGAWNSCKLAFWYLTLIKRLNVKTQHQRKGWNITPWWEIIGLNDIIVDANANSEILPLQKS